MNVHGYKQHVKGMRNMLALERTSSNPDQSKILRLEASIRRCNKKIKEIKRKRIPLKKNLKRVS